MQLRALAHVRSGDKGDIAQISVIAYQEADFERLRLSLTVERVAAHLSLLNCRSIERYELPKIGALNFVLVGAIQELRRMLTTPVIVASAIEAARELKPNINEDEVIAVLSGFGELWQTLFPAEQARIARLLIQRVTVNDNSIDVDLCTKGLGPIIHDMLAPRKAA